MKIIVTITLFALAVVAHAQQLELEVTGNATFNESALVINNAGSDFSSSIVMQSTFYLGINSRNQWDRWGSSKPSWRIEVWKDDLNWNNDLKLEIARTGDGNWWYFLFYGSQVTGGTNYVAVKDNSTYFFNGKGLLKDVPLQLRLSGFSLAQGADDFETTVILTIYDD